MNEPFVAYRIEVLSVSNLHAGAVVSLHWGADPVDSKGHTSPVVVNRAGTAEFRSEQLRARAAIHSRIVVEKTKLVLVLEGHRRSSRAGIATRVLDRMRKRDEVARASFRIDQHFPASAEDVSKQMTITHKSHPALVRECLLQRSQP
eukprot:m51a1_g2017 hypothetical protein (147) ;mRNA; f:1278636-1279132